MPIVTIALDHVSRIDIGNIPVCSPMLGSTSIYPEKSVTGSVSPISSPLVTPNEQFPLNSPLENDKPDTRKLRTSTISVSPSSATQKADLTLLDVPRSPDSTSVQSFPSPAVVAQSFSADWSKLSKDESRNLLVCVLFVLKHLDKGEISASTKLYLFSL